MSTNISLPGTTKKNASYVVTLDQYFWVKQEAKRLGVSEAEVVREALRQAMHVSDGDELVDEREAA